MYPCRRAWATSGPRCRPDSPLVVPPTRPSSQPRLLAPRRPFHSDGESPEPAARLPPPPHPIPTPETRAFAPGNLNGGSPVPHAPLPSAAAAPLRSPPQLSPAALGGRRSRASERRRRRRRGRRRRRVDSCTCVGNGRGGPSSHPAATPAAPGAAWSTAIRFCGLGEGPHRIGRSRDVKFSGSKILLCCRARSWACAVLLRREDGGHQSALIGRSHSSLRNV